MSFSSITDVMSRISQIEQQIGTLDGSNSADSNAASSSSSASSSSASDFSSALAQAQGSAETGPTASAASVDDGDSSFGSLSSSLLGSTTGTATTGTSGTTLPGNAGTMLTSDQQQFASTLSAETGLNPGVVTAWLLAEESGSAAQSRQAAGNNDWLNIGYTDSGTYGSSDSVWSDPVSAANATAQWLEGRNSISGYGTASTGIQDILQSVGQTPAAQISAIQQSGWSSGGYPSLDSLYGEVTG